MKKTFKSKTGTAIYIVIASTIAMLATPLFLPPVTWVEFTVCIASGLFIADFIVFTDYTIHNETLIVRCGHIIKWIVPITKITNISPTRSLASAPALSTDRILIKYGKYDEIVISPCRTAEFINDLKQINTNINIIS